MALLLPPHAPLEARSVVAHRRQFDLADGGDALFGHAVGGAISGDVVALGDLEDAADIVVDRAHHAHRALAVIAVDLERYVHHAAGVHGVVGRIQDAALFDFIADR